MLDTLECVMHLERCVEPMDIEMKRHSRAHGDPVLGASLDSRVRGNDQRV